MSNNYLKENIKLTGGLMSDRTKRALIRFGKVLASIILAGIAVKYGKSEYYLAISPLLVALDKYLRDK